MKSVVEITGSVIMCYNSPDWVRQLRLEYIPPSLHFSLLKPFIQCWELSLQEKDTTWPSQEATRETITTQSCLCLTVWKWVTLWVEGNQFYSATGMVRTHCDLLNRGWVPIVVSSWFNNCFFFFLFNCSTVDLQCFRCTSKWFGLSWWLSW